jgi:hypothetical protein
MKTKNTDPSDGIKTLRNFYLIIRNGLRNHGEETVSIILTVSSLSVDILYALGNAQT